MVLLVNQLYFKDHNQYHVRCKARVVLSQCTMKHAHMHAVDHMCINSGQYYVAKGC